MHDWSSLSHVRWDCKYHIVFVPKYRKKKLYGKFRSRVGEIIRDLCRQRGVDLLEGHLMPDHIHMCLSVPPKYSIAFVIGFIKGKSALLIHRTVLGKKRVSGLHFWARGYCVSTVGLDEDTIRKYIREQEKSEQEQLELEFDDEQIAPRGLSQSHRPPLGGLLRPPALREEHSLVIRLVLIWLLPFCYHNKQIQGKKS